MSRRLAIIGLALVVASELILIYALIQNPYAMDVGIELGAPTATAAAVLAGRMVSKGVGSRWATLPIPILTGLSYLGFAAFLTEVLAETVAISSHSCFPDFAPCAAPIDPVALITLGIGVTAVVGAAAIYLAALLRADSPTARLGRLGLLLLSVIPIVSVLGLLGLVILSSQKMKEIAA